MNNRKSFALVVARLALLLIVQKKHGKSGTKGGMMKMINIVRKGIWPIPDEARKCPVCGNIREIYQFTLENKLYANPVAEKLQQYRMVNFIQKYPTFTCDLCQTIWQYLGKKEEDKE